MRRLALESQGAALLLEIVIRSTLDQFLLLFLLGREHDLVSGGVRARQHVVNHLNTPSRFGSLYIRRPLQVVLALGGLDFVTGSGYMRSERKTIPPSSTAGAPGRCLEDPNHALRYFLRYSLVPLHGNMLTKVDASFGNMTPDGSVLVGNHLNLYAHCLSTFTRIASISCINKECNEITWETGSILFHKLPPCKPSGLPWFISRTLITDRW